MNSSGEAAPNRRGGTDVPRAAIAPEISTILRIDVRQYENLFWRESGIPHSIGAPAP
jgi:hypothetical protein